MNYKSLADSQTLSRTVAALTKKGYGVITVKNTHDALQALIRHIPAGASVTNGASVTLEQIGYKEYLSKGEHAWIDLHAKINGESDAQKRAQIRRESVLSDYYIGSVHALTENGEAIIASNTGSQLPHIAFTSTHIIFVVSTKKIVSNIEDGMDRLEHHVVPLEDAHMQELYHVGTAPNKILIVNGENPMIGRTITYILVEDDLGF